MWVDRGSDALDSLYAPALGVFGVLSITGATAANACPVWLRDGRALLFLSNRDGGNDVYGVALDRRGGAATEPRSRAYTVW